jgi:hypothetical protein
MLICSILSAAIRSTNPTTVINTDAPMSTMFSLYPLMPMMTLLSDTIIAITPINLNTFFHNSLFIS